MLSRNDFMPIKALAAGNDGAMNGGIILVRTRKGTKAIEKRLTSSANRSGFARREVKTMELCKHPNVVAMLGYDRDSRGNYNSVYMEFCEMGSLEGVLTQFIKRREKIPEGFMWKVLFDMSLALCYLQSGFDATSSAKAGVVIGREKSRKDWDEIVHCDIKPGNIFLTMHGATSQYPTVVLGDLGCSVSDSSRHKWWHEMDAWTSAFGPPEAPQYSGSSDIYSLALSVHCMATLRQGPPSDREKRRREPVGPQRASGYSNTIAQLLKRMLAHGAKERPDAMYLPYLVYREKSASKKEMGDCRRASRALPSWATG
jgi:NIMA (never in mitosis gene a)-related kinase